MSDDLLSAQAVVVSAANERRDLLRQAAAVATLPVEIIDADGAASAARSLAGVDLVLLDADLGSEQIRRVVAAARGAAKPPFTVLLAAAIAPAPFPTDALAAKPSHLEEAKLLMERMPRVRLPSRVLIVDDSATMRSIVRKIVAATRFPLEIIEASQGMEAIERARQVDFNIVFLDYNMPGFRPGNDGRVQAREPAPDLRADDANGRRRSRLARPCAGRCLSEKAVLSRRYRGGAVPLLRP
jgi:Response regulator receiver domain